METGQLARQAAAAVVIQYGGTVVINAVTDGPPRPGIDFFPLMCDYRERFAAAGKFPGGFLKREGRPSTKETLASRLIDRPIRPLFPPGYADEVQCQSVVLSSDRQNDADVLAMNGTAAALLISPIPFLGPIASVRVGRLEGQFVPFPTHEELEDSELDLVVSGTEQAVAMIEGFARELPEDTMAAAIAYAHDIIKEIIALQRELAAQVNVQKVAYVPPADDGLYDRLKGRYYDEFKTVKQTEGKQTRAEAVRALRERVMAEVIPNPEAEEAVKLVAFDAAWHRFEATVVRDLILAGTRPTAVGARSCGRSSVWWMSCRGPTDRPCSSGVRPRRW